jgi:hypothetical protein
MQRCNFHLSCVLAYRLFISILVSLLKYPWLFMIGLWLFFFLTQKECREREREGVIFEDFFFSLPLTISIVGSVLLVFIHKPIKKLVRV